MNQQESRYASFPGASTPEVIEIRPIDYRSDPQAQVAADLIYRTVLYGLDPGDDAANAYHLRATDLRTFCATNKESQRLVGVVALCLSDTLDRVGYVEDVAVIEPVRRQGVGARLLAHVERQAQVAGLVTLRLTSLQRALPFYLKLGYEPRSLGGPYDLEKQLPDV